MYILYNTLRKMKFLVFADEKNNSIEFGNSCRNTQLCYARLNFQIFWVKYLYLLIDMSHTRY